MAPRSALAACAALAAGCASDLTPVEGADRSAWFPALNATWDLRPPQRPRDDDVTGSLAVELDAWSSGGHDTFALGPGEHVAIDDRDFFGPAELDVDWQVVDVTLAARVGASFGSWVRVEGIFGLEGEVLDLEVGDESERRTDIGPCLGAQLTLTLVERVSIEGRWQEYVGVWGAGGDGSLLATIEQWRVGIACEATDRIGLFAGWNWWEHDRDESGDESGVKLATSGPMVALRLRF
jgi:hypothetical protein